MNIREYVNDLHITVGETKRMDCPSCTSKNTFTVTNNMGALLWNCYKLSCSLSGSSRVTLTIEDIRTAMDRQIKEQETFQ